MTVTVVVKPAAFQMVWASFARAPTKLGIWHGIGVGTGVADGSGVGLGLGNGLGVGTGVLTGVVPARPARIGNTDSASMVIEFPSSSETIGVISVNVHVNVTRAVSPRSVPAAKVGAGRVPGSVQFRAAASARIWAL